MVYDKIKYYDLNEVEREKLLEKLKLLLIESRVALAYLFGSIIRRNKVRDVDLMIYTIPRLSFKELLKLGARIELEVELPIDLVQLYDVSPTFKLKVLRQGVPIIMERQLHHRLIAQAFSELMDFKMSNKLAKNSYF